MFSIYKILTNSIKVSPWEAATCSATQEFPNILCNPKVHYCVHASRRHVPTLSHDNPATCIPSYSPILILTSYLRLVFPSDLFPSDLFTRILHTFFFSPIRATCLSHFHPTSPDLSNYIWPRQHFCLHSHKRLRHVVLNYEGESVNRSQMDIKQNIWYSKLEETFISRLILHQHWQTCPTTLLVRRKP
jgi:hypothetical protein